MSRLMAALCLLEAAVALAASPPPCMGPLVCPPGTTLRTAGQTEDCRSADGKAEGPGHGRTDAIIRGGGKTTPSGFRCWEAKGDKLVGKHLVYWASGELNEEHNYVDGEPRGPQRYFDERGKPAWVYDADGLSTQYFANGNKKVEGKYKAVPDRRGSLRDGVWTRWYENGKKRFTCDFVDGALSGSCSAWDENGKLLRKASYSDGGFVSGQEVGAMFNDNEPPLVGRLVAPTGTIDVATLLKSCAGIQDQLVHITGAVTSPYACPHCPPGAMCKPCAGDHFILGEGQTTVLVFGSSGAGLAATVELEAQVQHRFSQCSLALRRVVGH